MEVEEEGALVEDAVAVEEEGTVAVEEVTMVVEGSLVVVETLEVLVTLAMEAGAGAGAAAGVEEGTRVLIKDPSCPPIMFLVLFFQSNVSCSEFCFFSESFVGLVHRFSVCKSFC